MNKAMNKASGGGAVYRERPTIVLAAGMIYGDYAKVDQLKEEYPKTYRALETADALTNRVGSQIMSRQVTATVVVQVGEWKMPEVVHMIDVTRSDEHDFTTLCGKNTKEENILGTCVGRVTCSECKQKIQEMK